MLCYEIYMSIDFGPFEPYEDGGLLLTKERAELAVARLRYMTRHSGRYRYEIRRK